MTFPARIGNKHYAMKEFKLTDFQAQSVYPDQFRVQDFLNGTTPPTKSNIDGFVTWEFTINDDTRIHFKVPDEWFTGSDITIQGIWSCGEDEALNNGLANWQTTWEAVETDGTEAIGAGATATDTTGDTSIPATANSPLTSTFATIDGTLINRQDILSLEISRIALTGGGANPVAEPELIAIVVKYTATTAPGKVVRTRFTNYLFGLNDLTTMQFRIPDDWYIGTNMRISLAFACNENFAVADGEVQWRISYQATPTDGSEVIGAVAAVDLDSGDQNIPTTALQVQEVLVGDIDGDNLTLNDVVVFDVSRIAIDDGNNPNTPPEIAYVKVEYVSHFPTYLDE